MGGYRRWTLPALVAAGRDFVHTYGRLPCSQDLVAPSPYLPSYRTVNQRLGGLTAYQALITASVDSAGAPLEHSDCEAPDAPRTPQKAAMRLCLRCDRLFRSAWIGNRICAPCTRYPGACADDLGTATVRRLKRNAYGGRL